MTPTDWDARSIGFISSEDHLRWLLQQKDAEIDRLQAENAALRAAGAQPAEPVAWRVRLPPHTQWICVSEPIEQGGALEVQPLYTHPPHAEPASAPLLKLGKE